MIMRKVAIYGKGGIGKSINMLEHLDVYEKSRSRAAEFYLNGYCLIRAVCTARFERVPFFLRHLWSALAE